MYLGSSIASNTAPIGGGIRNAATVNMYGGSITGNTAEYGGGIYNIDPVNMYVGSSITSNKATTKGGGILNHAGPVTFKDSAGNIIATWPGYNTNVDPYGFFTPHNIRDDISTL
jgi:hypothetical protein